MLKNGVFSLFFLFLTKATTYGSRQWFFSTHFVFQQRRNMPFPAISHFFCFQFYYYYYYWCQHTHSSQIRRLIVIHIITVCLLSIQFTFLIKQCDKWVCEWMKWMPVDIYDGDKVCRCNSRQYDVVKFESLLRISFVISFEWSFNRLQRFTQTECCFFSFVYRNIPKRLWLYRI